ncbi:YeeE/YedE family protein [Caldisalinibacter kiritimatiensis]|uniref:YeeE/YedE n=1 Tax=Caldisalinibacter kiritimatiensis TaxID=1304284 RepID=R1AQ99_9FIRM|nr:YeeE/YedE family protein [Caldisalinibacter kiritimatiensis]EOC99302.1 YeeE/YedE [Caldisalinibacter kiritimatiensis]
MAKSNSPKESMLEVSSSHKIKDRRYKKSQMPLGIAFLVGVIIIEMLLYNISAKLGLFWLTGICFGFILQKSRFCFASAVRDPYLLGSTALTKAVLIAFAITTIGFTAIKSSAYSNGLPIPGQNYVVPISFATAIGAFMFGIGMVITGGCASSTLMRSGEGFILQLISLFFFIVGSLLGAHNFLWWKTNFIMHGKSIFLPDIFGWLGAVIIQLLIIGALYILANKLTNGKCLIIKRDFNLRDIVLKLIDNKFYKLWIKDSWPYIVGAVLLSVFQIVTLVATGNPWGVSESFSYWGAWLYTLIGGSVDKWYYFSSNSAQATLNLGFFNDPGSMRNMGIIFGALLASLLASQFRIKKVRSMKQVIAAILGGLLMGYGATIGLGCNIGGLYSGIASLSLSGWVYAIFLFLGSIVGSKLLERFFI